MIKLTDYEGRSHYLSPLAISRITESGPNWHGIACYVRTFDGKIIEVRETAAQVAEQVNQHLVFLQQDRSQAL